MSLADRCYRIGLFALAGLVLTAGDCFDPDEHSPTAPATQGALTVTLSAESIPADGTSTLVVTGTIDPGAEAANRVLVFTVNDGSLLEATASPFRSVERSVDASGQATATVRSSRNVRAVEIVVQVKSKPAIVVRTTVQFSRAEAGSTIAFVSLPSQVAADETTLTPITVQISEGIPSDKRTVTFTSNRGSFAGGTSGTATASAGADHRARVDLKSPLLPGEARVTATVDGVTVEAAVDFIAALPQTILVSPTKIVLQATNAEAGTTPVSVKLLRDDGKVSPTTVNVRLVEEGSGAELAALLRNLVPSNASGDLTFTLTAGSLTYRGPAILEVRVDGASAVGRARIEIVEPVAAT